MPKARLARELVRRKIAMAVGGSVSETYQPFAVEELTNIPADIEENLYRRIDETLKKYRQVVLPAALQAEYEALPNIIEPIATTYNEVVDYIDMHLYIPSGRIINGLLELARLYSKYTNMLRKRAQYLGKPMPKVTELKPLRFLIVSAARGLRRRIIR